MDTNLDLEQRFLCADGACIGVIGRDGRCSICVTPIDPREVARFERATGITLGPEFERIDGDLAADSTASSGPSWTPEPDEVPDLENRILCPDGSCIGVIGPDNNCKVCGRSNTNLSEADVVSATPTISSTDATPSEAEEEEEEVAEHSTTDATDDSADSELRSSTVDPSETDSPQ